MINWLRYEKQHEVAKGNTFYADVINHCKRYTEYMISGDPAGSAHECTHGINSDIRNAQESVSGRVNAFYVGGDKAIVLPEPEGVRKRDTIPHIANAQRGGRYSLYVSGQTEWDDSPLYLYDEWTAYINEAYAQYTLIKAGEPHQSNRYVDGHTEFIPYGAAVLMAVGHPEQALKDYFVYCCNRACSIYFKAKADNTFMDFEPQNKLFTELLSGEAAQPMRDFLKSEVHYVIPASDEVVHELDEEDFFLIEKKKPINLQPHRFDKRTYPPRCVTNVP